MIHVDFEFVSCPGVQRVNNAASEQETGTCKPAIFGIYFERDKKKSQLMIITSLIQQETSQRTAFIYFTFQLRENQTENKQKVGKHLNVTSYYKSYSVSSLLQKVDNISRSSLGIYMYLFIYDMSIYVMFVLLCLLSTGLMIDHTVQRVVQRCNSVFPQLSCLTSISQKRPLRWQLQNVEKH